MLETTKPAGSPVPQAPPAEATADEKVGHKPQQGLRTSSEAFQPKPLDSHVIAVVSDSPAQADTPDRDISCQLLHELPRIPESTLSAEKAKLERLAQAFTSGKYEQTLKLYPLIETQLKKESKLTAELERYLRQMQLIVDLNHNGILALSDILQQCSKTEYTEWFMALAQAIHHQSPCIGTQSKLDKSVELYCYRQAADCGAPDAQFLLAKELLFSPDPDANPLMPREAVRTLKEIVDFGITPPQPVDEYDQALIEMIRVISKRSLPGERDQLARQWLEHPNASIRQLAPMLYLDAAFGDIQPDDADRVLESLSASLSDAGYTTGEQTCSYWQAISHMHRGEDEKALVILQALAKERCDMAILPLAEHYLATSEWAAGFELFKSYCFAKDSHAKQFPDLAQALSECFQQYLENTCQGSTFQLNDNESYMLSIALNCIVEAQCHRDGRATQIQNKLLLKTEVPETLILNAGQLTEQELPKDFLDALAQNTHTEDPQLKVFQHFGDMVRTGTADDGLIAQAMLHDPVATLYRMAILAHSTESMSREGVLSKLLSITGGDIRSLMRFRHDPGFESLAKQLVNSAQYTDYPESALLLAKAIYGVIGASQESFRLLYSKLCEHYEQRQLTKEAEDSKALLAGTFSDGVLPDEEFENADEVKEMLLIDGLPEVYHRLMAFNPVSRHPLDTQCKAKQLLDIREKLKQEMNTAVRSSWVQKCCEFIESSCHTLSEETVLSLTKLIYTDIKEIQQGAIDTNNKLKDIIEDMSFPAEEVELSESCQQLRQDIISISPGSPLYRVRSPANYYSPYLQFPIEKTLESAGTLEEQLDNLDACLSNYDVDVDPFATALRAIPVLSRAQSLYPDRVVQIARKLDSIMPYTEKTFTSHSCDLQCQLLHSLCEYSRNKPSCDTSALSLETEKLMTEVAAADLPRLVSKLRFFREYPDMPFVLHQQLLAASAIERVQTITREFASDPCLAAMHFRHMHEAEVSSTDLDVLKLQTQEPQATPFSRIISAYLHSEPCGPLIISLMKDQRISQSDRVNLLCITCELGLVTPSMKQKLITASDATSDYDRVVSAVLNSYFDAMPNPKRIQRLVTEYPAAVAVLFRNYLRRQRPDQAHVLCKQQSELPSISCEQAMLEWRHDLTGRREIFVPAALTSAASRMNPKAQCRLADWLLENDYKLPIIRSRCYRYLATPVVNASPERDFYQGVTLFKGIGCTADEAKGTEQMKAALASSSPVPALQLAILVEKGHLPPGICAPAHPLELFIIKAQPLSPERAKELAEELVFDLGKTEIRRVINQLNEHSGSETLTTASIIAALEESLARWKSGVTASPVMSIRAALSEVKTKTTSKPQPDKETETTSVSAPSPAPVQTTGAAKGTATRPVTPEEQEVPVQVACLQEEKVEEPSTATEIASELMTEIISRTKKEASLRRQIVQLADVGCITDKYKPRLREAMIQLQQLQGKRFPELPDHDLTCSKLLKHMQLNFEAELVFAEQLFNSISSKPLKTECSKALLEAMRIETMTLNIANRGTPHMAKAIITLLPHDPLPPLVLFSLSNMIARLNMEQLLASDNSLTIAKHRVLFNTLVQQGKTSSVAAYFAAKAYDRGLSATERQINQAELFEAIAIAPEALIPEVLSCQGISRRSKMEFYLALSEEQRRMCEAFIESEKLHEELFKSISPAAKKKAEVKAEAVQAMEAGENEDSPVPDFQRLIALYKALRKSISADDLQVRNKLGFYLYRRANDVFALKGDSDERQKHILLATAAKHLVI